MLESLVRNFCQNACTIRPGYLYGFSPGELDYRLSSVRRQLLSGGAVYYAEDMFKSPMEVMLAAEAVAELALSNHIGTVHVSGELTSIYAFYRDALSFLGLPTEKLEKLYKNCLPADATVPRDTSLEATLMTKLTNVPILSVQKRLEKSAGRQRVQSSNY